MSLSHLSLRLNLLLALVCVGIASRFLPHPPNFTALNAICLFGAYAFGSLRWTLASIFLTLFLSDCVIGFYATIFSVYVSFGLVAMMGYWLFLKFSLRGLALATPLASLLFFLVTNFSSWLTEPVYPKTLFGLGLAYMAGLPFLAFQLMGDLFYAVLLFGVFLQMKQGYSLFQSSKI